MDDFIKVLTEGTNDIDSDPTFIPKYIDYCVKQFKLRCFARIRAPCALVQGQKHFMGRMGTLAYNVRLTINNKTAGNHPYISALQFFQRCFLGFFLINTLLQELC